MSMDKWNIVQTAHELLWLLCDNWDRFENGEELDEGVAKVGGRRTEGLSASRDGVSVDLLKVEWKRVCRVTLPDGRKIETEHLGLRDENMLADLTHYALWQLVWALREEDAQ